MDLTAWSNGLPGDVADRFRALRVQDLVSMSLEEQLAQDWCVTLDEHLKRAVASGSLVTAVKRAPMEPLVAAGDGAMERLTAETAMLRDRIEQLEKSTSWRITAPVRHVGALLKRLSRLPRIIDIR
ncbi:hypothetical protein [Rhodopila sp.]|uniref:hypothetical protein n=1 Tax=Rhodopila sp. TaxID=2480087 RepID=UPI002CD36744|nr:hypothetical protein [Rhodopila sp.]HVZ09510.1 hypothetical protein [Rhodopila sp.]